MARRPSKKKAAAPATPSGKGLDVSTLTRRTPLADAKALAVAPGLVVRVMRDGVGNQAPVKAVGPNGAVTLDNYGVIQHKSVVDQLPADDAERRNGYWEFAS